MSPLAFAVACLVGVAVGTTLHELAHWSVLSAGGREPELVPPSLSARRATVGLRWQRLRGDRVERLAAVAPQLVGVVVVPPLLVVGTVSQPVFVAVVVAGVWLLKPSRADLAVAKGQTQIA